MNIKSFFNTTVLKKDLTRFMPLWVIYLILGLLSLTLCQSDQYWTVAEIVSDYLNILSVISMIYALLTAQMLFGDLFQSRLCNAIHALPVRREGLFFTHFAAGMAMNMGPNLLVTLVIMPGMGRLWYMALLCYLAMTLQYLIFFSIALFCMHCAGNRFAAVAIYALVNFVALVVMVYFATFYMPMLYGIEMTEKLQGVFFLFSPVVKMVDGGKWLINEHSPYCPVKHESSLGPFFDCVYYFKEFGDIWTYVLIVTAVGLLFAAAAFFIYRKRHMETAGEFVSFKPMGTVFTLLASASVALAFHAVVPTLGLIVGALVGFFVCRMLLERTIKVFNKKSWLQLTVLCLVMGLTLVLTALDVGGVTRRIPKAEDVTSVTIADRHLSDWQLENLSKEQEEDANIVPTGADRYYKYNSEGMMTLTEAKDIEKIRAVHQLLIEEGDARQHHEYPYYQTITIHYVLKNGKTLTRYYYTALESPAIKALEGYTSSPAFILGHETPEDMLEYLQSVDIYRERELPTVKDRVWLEKLVNALFADAEEGNLSGGYGIHFEISLNYEYGDGRYGGQYFSIPYGASHTEGWLKEYKAWCNENNQSAT